MTNLFRLFLNLGLKPERKWFDKNLSQNEDESLWRGLLGQDKHSEQSLYPIFDADWYRQEYMRDDTSEDQPLRHFQKYYKHGNYSPNLLFDSLYYVTRYPDIEFARLNPLTHYLTYGAAELRKPHPLFDTKYYLNHNNISVRRTGLNPLSHFLIFGAEYNSNPNAYFDSLWYRKKYMSDGDTKVIPLVHYIKKGEKLGYWPSMRFDPVFYISYYDDLLEIESGLSPLAHFLDHGIVEKRVGTLAKISCSVGEVKAFVNSARASGDEPSHTSIVGQVTRIKDYVNRNSSQADDIVLSHQTSKAIGIQSKLKFPLAPYVAKLSEVFAVSGTRYVLGDNLILSDEETIFQNAKDADVKWNCAKRLPSKELVLDVVARPGAWLNSGINLMHEYSNNYFHFITETIPRMMLCEELDLPKEVPFVFEDNLHSNLKQIIFSLNTKKRPILWLRVGEIYKFNLMYWPSDMSSVVDAYKNGPEKLETALSVDYIRRGVVRCKSLVAEQDGMEPSRKIFLTRNNHMRGLINENELISELVDEGFEILNTSVMDLESQIKIFRSAKVIVGPTGAAITNLVWCYPNTRVFILASDHPSHQLYFWDLLAKVSDCQVKIIQGPRAYKVTGKYALHDDYSIDKGMVLNSLLDIE